MPNGGETVEAAREEVETGEVEEEAPMGVGDAGAAEASAPTDDGVGAEEGVVVEGAAEVGTLAPAAKGA